MANEQPTDQVLRVSNSSSPARLAAAISHALYDGKKVVLRAIGAGAVNQSMKGIAIASSYVAQRSLTIACRPGFDTVEVSGEKVTAIVIRVWAE